MTKTEDKPFVENYPALRDWLHEHDSRCDFQLPIGDKREPHAYVESWLVRGVPVVIFVNANRRGFEIFTSCASNQIAATIADANKRIARHMKPADGEPA